MQDLGTLGGPRKKLRSEAVSVNAIGQVVGWSDTNATGQRTHAVLWATGKRRDLGANLADWSHANAINRRGQIVGQAGPGRALESTAFVWERGAVTRLGGDRSEALAISDAGRIVGIYETPDIATHAALWTKR